MLSMSLDNTMFKFIYSKLSLSHNAVRKSTTFQIPPPCCDWLMLFLIDRSSQILPTPLPLTLHCPNLLPYTMVGRVNTHLETNSPLIFSWVVIAGLHFQ